MQNFIFRKRCTLTIVAAYIIRDKTKKGGRVICWRRLRGCRSNLTFFLSLSLSPFGNFVLIYGTTRSPLEWNENDLENFCRETMQSHLT